MSERPDVSILLDHFGPGGVERVACHVANGLWRRGLRVEVVALENSGPVRGLLDENIPLHVLATAPGLRRRHRLKAAVPAIASYLHHRSPRIFHSPGNHTTRPAALGIALSRYQGAFVAKITNPLLDDRMSPRRRWLRRSAYAWALRKARIILTLAPKAIDQVMEIDERLAERTRAIHNPYVTASMLDRAVERNPLEPPVILAIGRLSIQKNHSLLLRAAARLDGQAWRIRICGTGPEEDAIRALARELGIADRLDLPGYVSDPVPEYLSATVLAQSSRWEGFPATVIEAMASGCPVVSTASSPALIDFMHTIGARPVVAVEDEAGFSEALAAALNGSLPSVDPTAARLYSVEAASEEHAIMFEEILASELTNCRIPDRGYPPPRSPDSAR